MLRGRCEVLVALVMLSCLVAVVLFISLLINNESKESDVVTEKLRDESPTSRHRRLLTINDRRDAREESNFTQSQRAVDASDRAAPALENHVLPEDLRYTERAILNFTPSDDEQYRNSGGDVLRKNLWIIMHVALSCYCLWMLAIISDEYFIASVHIFCQNSNIKHELAAGTIMVVATSSPELCISCASAFITDGDIGIGTIVGSTIFNVLAVSACCAIFACSIIKVDAVQISRDCFFYALSILGLIVVIYDHRIEWYEAVLMVVAYFVYLIIMSSSDLMSKKIKLVAQNIKTQFVKVSYYAHNVSLAEITPFFMRTDCTIINITNTKASASTSECQNRPRDECATSPWKRPAETSIFIFILRWPITFVLWCSIPDCRRYGSLYVVTFINCVAWILTLSYLIASMIANVDSIMGMIFVGACTSMPDAVYSVMQTMKGNADIGLSNAISANIYDILLCLGLPWSAKTLIVPMMSGQSRITLDSTGITYSAISLLATLGLFYLLLLFNRFKLDKKIGIGCFLFYGLFLMYTFLLEMDLTFAISFPTAVTINGLI